MTKRSLIASATAAAAALGFSFLSAEAAEFCVSCDGPAAQYACSIDGAAAESGDPRLKLYCMTELAKSGGHARCSIDRAQPKPCGGIAKVLGAPEGLELAKPQAPAPADVVPPESETAAKPSPATPAPAPTAQTGVQETTVAKTPAPPKTVKEMLEKSSEPAAGNMEKSGDTASSAVKSAGSALEKAGQAVGAAAKKTWTCVTSLFGDC